ncbi:rCG27835 [Rattus norvegicus]|uniref:RCG27835 n=1 Tax=Rattus norvegicus TaxID=10116 RepID=A6IEF1_RAT|nr:rCG27835 [Rattus norvegicus]
MPWSQRTESRRMHLGYLKDCGQAGSNSQVETCSHCTFLW